MKIVPAHEHIGEALEVLTDGGVIAHATETCYGLACDFSNVKAVERLFKIKQRPDNQPVSALFASIDQAKEYTEWNERAEELAKEYLPGPLTLILTMQEDAPFFLFPFPFSQAAEGKGKGGVGKNLTLGIRISSHPIAQELVVQFGKPISTTSANIHGKPNPYSAEDIAMQFADEEHKPDLILDSGTLPGQAPSKVIDLSGGEEVVLRQ